MLEFVCKVCPGGDFQQDLRQLRTWQPALRFFADVMSTEGRRLGGLNFL
jgi:hypothetical protein